MALLKAPELRDMSPRRAELSKAVGSTNWDSTFQDSFLCHGRRRVKSAVRIPSRAPRYQSLWGVPNMARSRSGIRNCSQNCRCPVQYSPSRYGRNDRVSMKIGWAPMNWML